MRFKYELSDEESEVELDLVRSGCVQKRLENE